MRFAQFHLKYILVVFLLALIAGVIPCEARELTSLPSLQSSQCDVSNSNLATTPCGVVINGAVGNAASGTSVNASIVAARSIAGALAQTAIDAKITATTHLCAYVNNATANSIFVPFRTYPEWAAFKANPPVGITLAPCAVPTTGGAFTISPGPTCLSPSPAMAKIDETLYAPANGTIIPAVSVPPFTCTVAGTCGPDGCGAPQTWTQTASVSFKAAAIPVGSTLPWTLTVSYAGTAPPPNPAPINGVCGSGTNNCSAGGGPTGLVINGASATWYCQGSNSGTTSAQCSDTTGTCSASPNGCSAGNLTSPAYSAPTYTWGCSGINDGSQVASCVACDTGYTLQAGVCVAVVTGSCGVTQFGCAAGTAIDQNDSGGDSTWICKGSGSGGDSPGCHVCDAGYSWNGSACVVPVTGTCGSATLTCGGSGTASTLTSDSTGTTWQCSGSGGGGPSGVCYTCDSGYSWSSGTCAPIINGTCGAAPGSCAPGSPSGFTDSGTSSSWSCLGANTGSNSLPCLACDSGYSWDVPSSSCVKNVSGSCGTGEYACATGSPINESTASGNYTWSCSGQGTGLTSTPCSSAIPVDATCGAGHYNCNGGVSVSNTDLGNGNYVWACNSTTGGNNSGTCHQCAAGYNWDNVGSCVPAYTGTWTAGDCSVTCGGGTTGTATCSIPGTCDPATQPQPAQCNQNACPNCTYGAVTIPANSDYITTDQTAVPCYGEGPGAGRHICVIDAYVLHCDNASHLTTSGYNRRVDERTASCKTYCVLNFFNTNLICGQEPWMSPAIPMGSCL